jgi:hypothetical protein
MAEWAEEKSENFCKDSRRPGRVESSSLRLQKRNNSNNNNNNERMKEEMKDKRGHCSITVYVIRSVDFWLVMDHKYLRK